MIVGGEKPPLNELSHFGVKGMKWGHHKMSDLAPSAQQVRSAAAATGNAVKKAAVKTGHAAVYVAHHKRMVAGGVVLAAVLHDTAVMGVRLGKAGILMKAAKNRQAAYEAGKIAMKALSSTAAKVNYAKMVKGAYKITTL